MHLHKTASGNFFPVLFFRGIESQLRRRDCSSVEPTHKQGPTPANPPSPEQDSETQQSTTAKPSFTGAQLPLIR